MRDCGFALLASLSAASASVDCDIGSEAARMPRPLVDKMHEGRKGRDVELRK